MAGPNHSPKSFAKPKNFSVTMKRLLKVVFNSKIKVALLIIFMIIAATLSALGPKVLGSATNELFNGLMSKQVTTAIEPVLAKQHLTLDQFKAISSNPDGTLNAEIIRKQDPASPLIEMLSQMKIRLGTGVDFQTLAYLLFLVVLVYFGTFATRTIGGFIGVGIVSKGCKKIRTQIEQKLWKLPLSYFDKVSTGELMSRVSNDLDNITQVLNQTGGDMIFMILMVIGVIAMMFTESWLLAIIAVGSIPLAGLIISLVVKKSQPLFKAQWKHTGDLNAIVEEAFTGFNLIQSFNKQENFKERFSISNEGLKDNGFKAQFISGMIMPITTFVTNINYVFVALIGGLQILSGQMTLGSVQAFIQYSRQFSQPLGQLSQIINQLQSAAASAERIFDLLDAKEMEDESKLINDFEVKTGQVEFVSIDFSYTKDQDLIQNLNLVANPGESVAIVGPTGAGKTTLVNLIMRFYDVDNGFIFVDGVNLDQVQKTAIRRNIGMVLQDTWLFNGTIRDNLLYGVQGIDNPKIALDTVGKERFEEACKATYVDHFVRTLEKGYDTILDDEGSELSVGEKQLLTICRAYISDPNILILDEATSSVDTRTESLVQKAMNELRSGRTSFIIAHRLSTIVNADVILYMENGTIVEQGSHEGLLKKNGKYATLYNSQYSNS